MLKSDTPQFLGHFGEMEISTYKEPLACAINNIQTNSLDTF
jgi:hypothetical protein